MPEDTFDEIENKLKELANLIFGSIFKFNNNLMKKSENTEYDPSFDEIFDFHITSHSLSLLKNICTNNTMSLGTFLNVRSIIESISLKKMYASGEITEEQESLLKIQFKIIERNSYMEYCSENSSIFSENIIKNYEEGRKFFLQHMPERELKKIEKNQLLFLCDDSKPIDIVKKYSPEFLEMYRICSQFIHPNDNQFLYRQDFKFITYHFSMISYIIDEYLIGSVTSSSKTFENWKKDCFTNPIVKKMFRYTTEFNKELSEICVVFRQIFGNNVYAANTLDIVQRLTLDLYYDLIFGLTEQIKSKFKIILELFAASGEFYKDTYHILKGDDFYFLLVNHTKNQFNRNMGFESDTKYAYELYKKLYPDGFDRFRFDRFFTKTTGFLITDSEPPSLTRLCKNFIDKIEGTDSNSKLKINEVLAMNYVESQILSHSNGYMWYSNTGAFLDSYAVGLSLKFFSQIYLKKIHTVYLLESIMDEKNMYKHIVNTLEKTIKRLEKITSEISKLELRPKIDISNMDDFF